MPDRPQAQQAQQAQPQPQPQSLVIEAWVPADCVLTPSLVLHNLALQGIPVKRQGTTITIDRGHYDCTGANYAVIAVTPLLLHGAPWSVCCSFVSHKAAQGMDPSALQSCWLGHCYVHWGATGAPCSYWHESGHAKTWKSEALSEAISNAKSEALSEANQSSAKSEALSEANQSNAKSEALSEAISEAMSSVSVEPVCQNKKSKNKSKLKRKLAALKKKLADLKAEVAALSQQVQAQHAATQRANQCMRDWSNLQVIERLCILEKALKALKAPTAPTAPTSLKAPNAPKAPTTENHCNPFDFYAIYEHYDKHHYFEDVVVPAITAPIDAININSDTDEDPDWFQLVQIEKVD